ncbi:MAG: phospho-N-acetylmuramoyl-pentapeptide-transferase [Candidatus Zixiibacteriota bacterium]
MLELIFKPYIDSFILLNLLRYITFRIGAAAVTAMLLSYIIGKFLIPRFYLLKFQEKINEDVPDRHLTKAGTPTMGGAIIIISLLVSTILWANITNLFILLALGSTLWMGFIGFIDDYMKMKHPKAKGLLAKHKFLSQAVLGLIVAFAIYFYFPVAELRTYTEVPFFKHYMINLGLFYIPFVTIVVSGSSNAINLTDGLDGLATGLIAIAASAFTVVAYISGRIDFSEYLNIKFLPGSGELAVFCAAIVGAALGFLWYNTHPAEIFLGDTGSLAMGTALGVTSILLKKEFLLILVGGVFVAETVSVILQVGSYKLRKKRIFKMAPIHHHFELCNWHESKIVVRFWIIGIICAIAGLSLLKLR